MPLSHTAGSTSAHMKAISITVPVVAQRVGQLAYREQNVQDSLTVDEWRSPPEE